MVVVMDLPVYDPESWQNDALCFRMGVDPNVMQPEQATRAEVAEALAICAGCPVIDACRAHAEEQDAKHVEAQTGAYGIHAGEWWGASPVWLAELTCAWCSKVKRMREHYEAEGWCCSRTCKRNLVRREAVPA